MSNEQKNPEQHKKQGNQTGELSEEDLDQVAGGLSVSGKRLTSTVEVTLDDSEILGPSPHM